MKTLKYIILGSIVFLVFAQFVLPETVAQAQGSQTGFQVTQKVRNLTKQSFVWVDSLQADPKDRLEFQITVIWKGTQSTQNVFVRETLPEKLIYANNLKLDSNFIAGDITKENINIGTMTSEQTKVLTFEAQVAPTESFPAGTSNLVNVLTVFNADGGSSITSTVHVVKAGTPTQVPTGPLQLWMIGLTLLLLTACVVGTFLFLRSYLKREVFESPYDTRVDRKLATMIRQIKTQAEKNS
ncbi:MAG: hypothetical protein AAB524_03060 [Patescibacteria group bacterium]